MTSLRELWFVMLLWSSSLLCGAESAPANATTGSRPRIVVLGDSITAGYGLERAQAYPALLQKKIDQAELLYEVLNAGVSGDTTAGGLRRLDWVLTSGADVLIIALGGNDGLRGLSPKQTAANLTAMIARARTKFPHITVILAGMQMPANLGPEFVEAFNGLFSEVASKSGTELLPFLLDGVGGILELNQPDLIHPNAEGQRRIADNVWRVLQKALEQRAAKPQ